MPPTAYLAPQRPISLQSLLEESSSSGTAPEVDLQWEPFQRHVEAFLTGIDNYVLRAKTEIVGRANDHAAFLRDKKAEKEEMERQIQLEREREVDMLSTLESERHTLTDLTSSLNHLQSSLAKVKDQSAALEADLSALRKEVKSEKAERERQGKVLDDMRDRDEVELRELEEVVGLKIEGIKADLLMLRFTLLDPADPTREFSILVDVSKQDYTVPNCDPSLPSLPDLVRQLNQDRQFFLFIKRVRKAFRALIPNPAPSTKFNELSGPGMAQRTPALGAGSRVLSHTTPSTGKDRDVVDGRTLESLSLVQ
ncbi:hypothetical protein IAU60_004536 [Kwoniella sp. DSM 27419]